MNIKDKTVLITGANPGVAARRGVPRRRRL
jgi:hypothetical protein